MAKGARRAEYEAYLQSSQWRQKRELALDRAKRKCERCSNRRDLHVHHLSYKHFKKEPLDDLMVLCKGCHADVHRAKFKIEVLPDASRRIVKKRKKASKPKGPRATAKANLRVRSVKLLEENEATREKLRKNRERREMNKSWGFLP